MKIEYPRLINAAFEAQKQSYSPYSGFAVGAALLTESGKIYKGCNIENAAYSPTNCAERTAFFKAVSEGEKSFLAIAIVGQKMGGAEPDYCSPCGVCRQVMVEFCDVDTFKVIMAIAESEYQEYLLKDLLPLSFSKESL
jgi:cytidine deaminase, homotetrameric